MMRFHPRSAAIVLGGALAVAAATPLAAVAQKNSPSGSSGKSSQGHHSTAGRHQNTSSGSGAGKSAHAAPSTGHQKTSAGHTSAAHHVKHRVEHLRKEIHRLELELRKEHLKHEHHLRARELEHLRHEVLRLERELHPDHLKHHHPPQQPAPPSNGTSSAAPPQQTNSHHAKYGRVEVTLPHAHTEVLVNGSKMKAEGTYRVFKTPDLTPGKRYTYRVVAMWQHNGNQIREERTVHLSAGATAQVHFHRPDHSPGQTSPGTTGTPDD